MWLLFKLINLVSNLLFLCLTILYVIFFFFLIVLSLIFHCCISIFFFILHLFYICSYSLFNLHVFKFKKRLFCFCSFFTFQWSLQYFCQYLHLFMLFFCFIFLRKPNINKRTTKAHLFSWWSFIFSSDFYLLLHLSSCANANGHHKQIWSHFTFSLLS